MAQDEPKPDRVLTETQNWGSRSHRELYDSVHLNNDPGRVGQLADEWIRIGKELEESAQQMTERVRGTESGWQGHAADSARTAINKLASWCQEAGGKANVVGSHVQQQGRIMEVAKTSMPEPVDAKLTPELERTYAGPGLNGMAAATADLRARQDNAKGAHQQAVAVMRQMENDSRSVDGGVPRFTPPPNPIRGDQREARVLTATKNGGPESTPEGKAGPNEPKHGNKPGETPESGPGAPGNPPPNPESPANTDPSNVGAPPAGSAPAGADPRSVPPISSGHGDSGPQSAPGTPLSQGGGGDSAEQTRRLKNVPQSSTGGLTTEPHDIPQLTVPESTTPQTTTPQGTTPQGITNPPHITPTSGDNPLPSRVTPGSDPSNIGGGGFGGAPRGGGDSSANRKSWSGSLPSIGGSGGGPATGGSGGSSGLGGGAGGSGGSGSGGSGSTTGPGARGGVGSLPASGGASGSPGGASGSSSAAGGGYGPAGGMGGGARGRGNGEEQRRTSKYVEGEQIVEVPGADLPPPVIGAGKQQKKKESGNDNAG